MAVSLHPKRFFRFSIGMLLFAMLCVSSFLGARRAGEQAGAKARYDESFFTKVYPVADLLIEPSDGEKRQALCDEIIQRLQAVAPQSWGLADADGQICDVHPFPDNASLVVSQYGAVHDQIDAALQEYRDQQLKSHADHAAAAMERLATRKDAAPVQLSHFSPNEPLALSALELQHQSVVRSLTERWGAPGFSGECTDARFPAWSVAQSISTWPKNGGEAYLAIQDRPDVGRVLLAGWRRHE